MAQRRSMRSRWQVATLRAIGATGFFSILTAVAAPPASSLRSLDPKTGLPKTWDSRVGRSAPPTKSSSKASQTCQTYDKAACADPAFVAKCPNAAQACKSFQELDACTASPPAGSNCGESFYTAHKAQLDAIPKAKRVVPSRRSLGTEAKQIGYVKSDPSKVTVKGMDHAFATRLAHPSASSAGAAGGKTLHRTSMKKALARIGKVGAPQDVGGLIDSCDEYAARKYLSLTQFDAEVSENQRNPRKTYDLVYSGKWTDLVKGSKVKDSEGKVSAFAPTASLAANGELVVQGDNWSIPLQFEPVSEPRNTFLLVATGFGRVDDTDAVLNKISLPSLGFPDYAALSPLKKVMADYAKKREVFFNQAFFRRRPFTKADNPMVAETFDWHKGKNNALWQEDSDDKPGRYTDEELRVRYDQQQDLGALVATRSELVSFIRDVGDVCRDKPPPPDLKAPNAKKLQSLVINLAKIAAALGKDFAHYQEFTASAKGFAEEASLVEAGVSKGFTMYDPVAKTQRRVSHSDIASWLEGPWKPPIFVLGSHYFYGPSCKSQTGCRVLANPITAAEVKSAAAAVSAQLVSAKEIADNIPMANAKQKQAFQSAMAGTKLKCERFGIPKLFKADKSKSTQRSDPDFINFNPLPPELSTDEAQTVANALKSNVLPKLEAVDALIAEQFNSGIELGCFSENANGCDWSPNRMIDYAHKYRRQMDLSREADTQRCKRYTTQSDKEGFTYKGRLNDLMKKYSWTDSRKSVKAFETLLLKSEEEMIRQLMDEISAIMAMQTYDDDGKTPALGQMTSTDGGFGDDMFGAEYNAGGGFRFGNLSTDKNGKFSKQDIEQGKKAGTANNFTYWAGNFANASVKILGSTNEVFNARMDIALTHDHLLEPQKGINKSDKDHLKDYLPKISKTYKPDHVQGHLHIRVAGSDLFDPIDQAIQPTFYASTEPLYQFEPASYDETIFDVSTTFVVVIVPVTLRGWATFHAGLNYSISAALDRANIDSLSQKLAKPKNPTPFQMNNTIEPYAEVEGNVMVTLGVPGCEVGVKGSLQLIRLGLPYHSAAAVRWVEGGKSSKDLKSAGNRFMADQGLDFKLNTLSGTVSGFVEFLLWSAEGEVFSWDGLESVTPIFNINMVDASVAMSSQAVRDLIKPPGFKLDE